MALAKDTQEIFPSINYQTKSIPREMALLVSPNSIVSGPHGQGHMFVLIFYSADLLHLGALIIGGLTSTIEIFVRVHACESTRVCMHILLPSKFIKNLYLKYCWKMRSGNIALYIR